MMKRANQGVAEQKNKRPRVVWIHLRSNLPSNQAGHHDRIA